MLDSARYSTFTYISLVLGIALLAGLVIVSSAPQEIEGSSHAGDSYLTGTWLVTLTIPGAGSRKAPCTFYGETIASKPKGSFVCIGNQRETQTGGLLASSVQGNWTYQGDSSFAITGLRMIYQQDNPTKLAGWQEASGVISIMKNDGGEKVLSGTIQIAIMGPEGDKTLQTIPDIEWEGHRVEVKPVEMKMNKK